MHSWLSRDSSGSRCRDKVLRQGAEMQSFSPDDTRSEHLPPWMSDGEYVIVCIRHPLSLHILYTFPSNTFCEFRAPPSNSFCAVCSPYPQLLFVRSSVLGDHQWLPCSFAFDLQLTCCLYFNYPFLPQFPFQTSELKLGAGPVAYYAGTY